jgi:hypothetical protein
MICARIDRLDVYADDKSLEMEEEADNSWGYWENDSDNDETGLDRASWVGVVKLISPSARS